MRQHRPHRVPRLLASASVIFVQVGRRAIGTVRYRRLASLDPECAKELPKRTLTNLYNQRPACLNHAHRRLDEAAVTAYGWPSDLSDDEILAKLLELNLAREPAR